MPPRHDRPVHPGMWPPVRPPAPGFYPGQAPPPFRPGFPPASMPYPSVSETLPFPTRHPVDMMQVKPIIINPNEGMWQTM